MTKPTDPNRMKELGRRGGLASAEARRKRKRLRWEDSYLEAVNGDPAGFTRAILESGNAAAKVRALELASAAKEAALTTWQDELERRERDVAAGEDMAVVHESWARSARAAYEMEEAKLETVRQEIAALEQSRDELRAAIALEAEAADMELVEEVGDAVA